MNVWLTGGRGFIGSHVLRKLINLGHMVTLIDSNEAQVHGKHVQRFPRAGDAFTRDLPDPEVVIHLAAKVGVGQSMTDPVDYVACNTLDTAKFLHKLRERKPKRLVVASSMSVYGEGLQGYTRYPDTGYETSTEPMPTPEWHPPNLHSIYALTKYDQEQLSLIWGRAHGVDTVALRFFNTYGEGQALTNPYTGALAIFATRLLNGKPPVIYEDGQQTRDFVHVEDVSDAVVHAALAGMAPGVYNVGTGVATTIEQVAVKLANALEVNIAPHITHQTRAGDIRHCYADTRKINATGWRAKVSFDEGIRRYAAWLKQQPLPEDRFDDAAGELAKAGLVK